MSNAIHRAVRRSLAVTLVALMLPGVVEIDNLWAQDAAAQARLIVEGATVYSNMCGRCHNPRPTLERDDRGWRTIVAHMRVRGNLTGGQARSVLAFLQATNGDTGQPGSVASAGTSSEEPSPVELPPPSDARTKEFPHAARRPWQYVTVMITSSGYDPATVTVTHGDVVRFVQMDVPAHNIEFHSAPEGARMAPRYRAVSNLDVLRPTSPPARVGPFLIGEGRTYEIRIGEDMPQGVYEFGCSRHTKWRGLIVVEDEDDATVGSPDSR